MFIEVILKDVDHRNAQETKSYAFKIPFRPEQNYRCVQDYFENLVNYPIEELSVCSARKDFFAKFPVITLFEYIKVQKFTLKEINDFITELNVIEDLNIINLINSQMRYLTNRG